MRKVKYITILIIIILWGCEKPKKIIPDKNFITDDLHKKFELSKPPNRIITLAPNLTELVFELGFGNRIIGNTSYCNYPDSAKKIENVADLLSVNLEKISVLHPDLIFITVEGNSKSDYKRLVDLGYKVFVSNPRNYNGIKKTLVDMGKIFNSEKKAHIIINNWDTRIEAVKAKQNHLVFKTVMFLISTKPIFSVGKSSFVNQILTYAGLENIFAESDVSYPMLNREAIIARNPDYIILYENNKNSIDDLLKMYPEWNTLSAIIGKRVFFINADLYSRPGPRFVDAVENLYKLISH